MTDLLGNFIDELSDEVDIAVTSDKLKRIPEVMAIVREMSEMLTKAKLEVTLLSHEKDSSEDGFDQWLTKEMNNRTRPILDKYIKAVELVIQEQGLI